MGIKSIINTDRLYWLGRYSERVYTTLKLFSASFDVLIEQNGSGYDEFCRSLEIPNIYKDKDDFIEVYAFSAADPNSIRSNLNRAYDNAIELREEIGSSSLSYIQMAMYEMDKAHDSEAPALHFQKIADCILAFWGCVDDQIDDENTRNIIKIGKRIERLDLYARLRKDKESLERELKRLMGRIDRTDLLYDKEHMEKLYELVVLGESEVLTSEKYEAIVRETEQLLG